MKVYYLICYDIADPFRLQQVSRFLKGVGIHVQYSVFYCYLSPANVKKIKTELKAIIDNDKDDIRFYPILSKFKPVVLGRGERVPSGVEIVLD